MCSLGEELDTLILISFTLKSRPRLPVAITNIDTFVRSGTGEQRFPGLGFLLFRPVASYSFSYTS